MLNQPEFNGKFSYYFTSDFLINQKNLLVFENIEALENSQDLWQKLFDKNAQVIALTHSMFGVNAKALSSVSTQRPGWETIFFKSIDQHSNKRDEISHTTIKMNLNEIIEWLPTQLARQSVLLMCNLEQRLELSQIQRFGRIIEQGHKVTKTDCFYLKTLS